MVGLAAGWGGVPASAYCVTWQEAEVTSPEDMALSREVDEMHVDIGGGNWLQVVVSSSSSTTHHTTPLLLLLIIIIII